MVKIRLRRVGARKQPSYRVVVTDSRSPRDGRFIEAIGIYNPRTEPETVRIEEERALYWLGVGAQPTEPVARLLKNQGTLARLERLRAGEPLEELLAEAEEALKEESTITPEAESESVAREESEEAEEIEAKEEQEESEELSAESEPSSEALEEQEGEETGETEDTEE